MLYCYLFILHNCIEFILVLFLAQNAATAVLDHMVTFATSYECEFYILTFNDQ